MDLEGGGCGDWRVGKKELLGLEEGKGLLGMGKEVGDEGGRGRVIGCVG